MSLDNKAYRVDIYQENYSGNVEVLKGAATPFYTQEDDDDDVFSPIRTSSGYLTVIVENLQLIDDILPNDDHDRYVELVDVTNSLQPKRVWNGFIAPDLYSGTWDRVPFELQLPLLSPLEAAKGTRFVPTERMVEVRDILHTLFLRYIDVQPNYFYIAKLDDGDTTPSRCPFLDATLTDNIFLPEEDDEGLVPIVGSDPLEPLKADCYSAYQVMQALCKLFGYVLYETPDVYYFASPDKTNTYRRVAWADWHYADHPTVVFPDHQFPAIMGNGHVRDLLPGKSLVRVFCNLEELTTLLSTDLHTSDYDSGRGHAHGNPYGYCYPPSGNRGTAYLEYVRLNCSLHNCSQYVNNPPAGIPLSDPINAHFENYYADGREYVGGNWVNYIEAKYNRGPYEFVKNEEALIVITTESGYTDNLYAGSLYSKRNYSAINVGSYLMIDFKVEFSDDFFGKFDYAVSADDLDLPCALKWGDYYYQGDGTWATRWALFNIKIYPEDNEGTVFTPHSEFIPGADIRIPSNMLTELQGQLRLIFYTFPEDGGIYMLKITDIEIKLVDNEVRPRVQDKYDYSTVDFRQRLSQYRLSEYKYQQVLTNHCINYTLSGVQTADPITDTSYEELLLSRLAQWYDRTIEQLTVTVENEDIPPGARIIRGSNKYIVLSRTIDWRNGQQVLIIQRLYDEQQQT